MFLAFTLQLMLPEGLEWARLVRCRHEASSGVWSGSSGVWSGSTGVDRSIVEGGMFLAFTLQLMLPEGLEWARLVRGRHVGAVCLNRQAIEIGEGILNQRYALSVSVAADLFNGN